MNPTVGRPNRDKVGPRMHLRRKSTGRRSNEQTFTGLSVMGVFAQTQGGRARCGGSHDPARWAWKGEGEQRILEYDVVVLFDRACGRM